MAKKRTFSHNGKRRSVEVTTKLTDQEAIDALGGFSGGGFESDCAFEINKQKNGYEGKPSLIAWGFKLAEDRVNAPATVCLSKVVRKRVVFRKPVRGVIDALPLLISQCGPTAKNPHHYGISDGAGFREGDWYGYADPDGNWSPRSGTPQVVIDALTDEKHKW